MKTLSIDVRRAEPHDARAISETHRLAWQHTYAGIIPHRALTQMIERRGENWWRKATRGPATLLVLDVAGTVAGYATLGLNRARALPQEGEIYEIYLRPEYQGIGLGRMLFGEARRLLKSLGCTGWLSGASRKTRPPAASTAITAGIDFCEGMENFDHKQFEENRLHLELSRPACSPLISARILMWLAADVITHW